MSATPTTIQPSDIPTPEGIGRPIVIEARGLAKRYGEIEAVRGVDLQVYAGETFGFLGPNGAGKSTTISMLCTLARPTGGWARVAGCDVVRQPRDVRRHIGLVFQDTTLDDYLTARENLRLHAELYGVPPREVAARLDWALAIVDLGDRADSLVRTFSGGMKRRLEIARGLIHAPRVLFLDEPTVGLDPQTRSHIWEYLVALRRREGVTIFLTTHYMDEAEHCDRIAIIDHGQIVVQDTPERLKAAVGKDRVTLRTADDAAARAALLERFGLQPLGGDEGITVHVANGAALIPRLVSELGVDVRSVEMARPTLDDVFLAHTGRTMRETEASVADRNRANPFVRSRMAR